MLLLLEAGGGIEAVLHMEGKMYVAEVLLSRQVVNPALGCGSIVIERSHPLSLDG